MCRMAGVDYATVLSNIIQACRPGTTSITNFQVLEKFNDEWAAAPAVVIYAAGAMHRDDSLISRSSIVPVAVYCRGKNKQTALDVAQEVTDAVDYWGYTACSVSRSIAAVNDDSECDGDVTYTLPDSIHHHVAASGTGIVGVCRVTPRLNLFSTHTYSVVVKYYVFSMTRTGSPLGGSVHLYYNASVLVPDFATASIILNWLDTATSYTTTYELSGYTDDSLISVDISAATASYLTAISTHTASTYLGWAFVTAGTNSTNYSIYGRDTANTNPTKYPTLIIKDLLTNQPSKIIKLNDGRPNQISDGTWEVQLALNLLYNGVSKVIT